jgi:hypothetical protein
MAVADGIITLLLGCFVYCGMLLIVFDIPERNQLTKVSKSPVQSSLGVIDTVDRTAYHLGMRIK